MKMNIDGEKHLIISAACNQTAEPMPPTITILPPHSCVKTEDHRIRGCIYRVWVRAFGNASLPIASRARSLVSLLTLDKKI